MNSAPDTPVVVRWYHTVAAVAILFAAVSCIAVTVYAIVYDFCRPATPVELAWFEYRFRFAITSEQTAMGYRPDPVKRASQQHEVDKVLWALVAEAHKIDVLVSELNQPRLSFLNQALDDHADVADIQRKVAEINKQIAAANNQRAAIQREWEADQVLLFRCRFGDGGARNFSTAIYKYKNWLKSQKPPPGG